MKAHELHDWEMALEIPSEQVHTQNDPQKLREQNVYLTALLRGVITGLGIAPHGAGGATPAGSTINADTLRPTISALVHNTLQGLFTQSFIVGKDRSYMQGAFTHSEMQLIDEIITAIRIVLPSQGDTHGN